MKRALNIKHNDGSPDKELEIGKAVAVDSPKEFIYWEKMADGKWQLTFSKGTVEDFSTIESFEMVREDSFVTASDDKVIAIAKGIMGTHRELFQKLAEID